MTYVGRKIYFDKLTGNIIQDTGEKLGNVRETTQEEDFQVYQTLAERVPETVGVIQLTYGQYAQDFQACNGYRVNPDTMQIEFSYPDPNIPPEEPVYRPPLTIEVEELKQEKLNLQLALAETIEKQETDKVNNQLALAELIETLVTKGVL